MIPNLSPPKPNTHVRRFTRFTAAAYTLANRFFFYSPAYADSAQPPQAAPPPSDTLPSQPGKQHQRLRRYLLSTAKYGLVGAVIGSALAYSSNYFSWHPATFKRAFQTISILSGSSLAIILGLAHAFYRSERKFDELAHNVMFDTLTGSRTRNCILAELDDAMKRADREAYGQVGSHEFGAPRAGRRTPHMTIFMMDLDRFKKVNDSFGHPVGDVVLREFINLFLYTDAPSTNPPLIREVDKVGRYGGEEFILVLEGCSEAGAQIVAEKVVAAVTDNLGSMVLANWPHGDKSKPNQLTLGVSIGTATYHPKSHKQDTISLGDMSTTQTASSVGELIYQADIALYVAKGRGRARFVQWFLGIEDELEQLKAREPPK